MHLCACRYMFAEEDDVILEKAQSNKELREETGFS